MDLQQLAAYLQRDARELSKLANRGYLPGQKVAGHWRFARAEINHWIETQLPAYTEQQLTAVITDHFYQATYHGFFYRVKSDFQVYVSRPNAGIGVEDYFTTEAMGSALDALQATELP